MGSDCGLVCCVEKKLLLYDDANVDFRDADVLMSQELMNRKLNKNGANHLAPGMVSGREVQKGDSEEQKGGLDAPGLAESGLDCGEGKTPVHLLLLAEKSSSR